MTIEDIFNQFKSLCEDVFEEEELEFTIEDEVEDIEEWDSMNHIHLVVAVEKHFKIKFAGNELQSFETVKDFLKIIQKHL
jgi:acyl carrier protein